MQSPAPTPASRLLAAAERVARDAAAGGPAGSLAALDDDALLELMTDATEARKALDLIVSTATAEVARRSQRDLGYEGLAQRKGHRNVTPLVQNITGQSRGDVSRQLRTGEELADAAASGLGIDEGSGGGGLGTGDRERGDEPGAEPGGGPGAGPGAVPAAVTWLGSLRAALSDGRVTTQQFEAIRRGLGDPPVERYPHLDPGFLPTAWAEAVRVLLDEASTLPVEELRAAARTARDRLDPIGVTLRFEERFATRSYRMWVDESGQHQGRFTFDDDAAAWVHSMLQAALRPRRGPRFVGADAAAKASEARADDRSNEQLQYDTLMAVLRTGAAADPAQAFGDRQPGVRIIVEATAIDGAGGRGATQVTGVGHLEDGGAALPAGVVETYLCDAGSLRVVRDEHGRPLDLGREQRLFSRAQRIGIAARDGGCVWPSCVAPPSQCEYHHIDHWWDHHGRTDVDDGVPLCRNCHLRLHNQGWRITRRRDPDSDADAYWLHPPPDPATGEVGEPTRLRSKSPLRFTAA